MATLVTKFSSGDSGAPAINSTKGSLVNVLSHCLIIGKVFATTATDADSGWTDNTTEARLNGGTNFFLFPGSSNAGLTTDRTYFGHSSKFTRLVFAFGTLGTTATYVWEYWNGSAWTTLSVTDGTSAFTAAGSVTWTAPSDWATVVRNSSTLYWVRVRFTGTAPATPPQVNSVSYLGWLEYFSGTNQRDYRAGAGNQFYVSVNDNGPNVTSLGKEARAIGFETTSALGVGTGSFPTAAQVATFITWRKSAEADGGSTARTWVCYANDRFFYLLVLTGDTAGKYFECAFGTINPLLGSDAYATILIGAVSENSSGTRNLSGIVVLISQVNNGHYMPRAYTGSGTAIQVGKHGDSAKSGNATTLIGTVPYPNGPDGGLYLSPVWVHESTSNIRGILPGLWHYCHAISNFTDLDIVSGTGALAGKTFTLHKTTSDGLGALVIETSDTWDA